MISALSVPLPCPFGRPLSCSSSPRRGARARSDYAKIDLEKLGVKSISAKKDDKTGFVVGGKNATDLVSKLPEIAGESIADLEAQMRPADCPRAGFLGVEERLWDVLTADNKYVIDELGRTHQELARHLLVLGAVAQKEAAAETKEITYHGRKFKVKAKTFKAFVRSPFDDGTRTNCEVTVENVQSGKKLTYSLLVPQMVERDGFYEGKGTRYRVEPCTIVEVLDFLEERDEVRGQRSEVRGQRNNSSGPLTSSLFPRLCPKA